MNQDRLKLWTAALRSGEYSQTTGQLGRFDDSGKASYCCLGVLCEVAIANGLELNVCVIDTQDPCHCGDCEDTSGALAGTVLYNDEESQLPSAVRQWLDLDTATPEVEATKEITDRTINNGFCPNGDMVSVITLNDEAEMTFVEIADVLEATYLKGDNQ